MTNAVVFSCTCEHEHVREHKHVREHEREPLPPLLLRLLPRDENDIGLHVNRREMFSSQLSELLFATALFALEIDHVLLALVANATTVRALLVGQHLVHMEEN